VSKLELLGIAANLVGRLVAYQNPRIVTPEIAMQVVHSNIEIGNLQAIEEISGKVGTA
jgi:hypothetical protein